MDIAQAISQATEKIAASQLLNADDIPKIDLYMEQVLSLLEQEMGNSLRREDEVVFTKTMVNNYTKEGVLPRPEKKKYNKQHIIMLAYIFVLKQILSIQDVKAFFSLLTDDDSLEPLYSIFYETVNDYREEYSRLVDNRLEKIEEKLASHGVQNDEMKLMMFISLLCVEAFANKMICSRLLADVQTDKESEETAAAKKEKGK